MGEQSGNFLYCIACTLAGFVAALAVISYFFNTPRGLPIVSVAALALAAAIWLSGWAGRNMIAGR